MYLQRKNQHCIFILSVLFCSETCFIFCRNFAGNFFHRRRIFADFKTEFWKFSRSQAYIPISRWCFGEHFLRKFIRKPQFCSERWSSRAQSIVLFSFAAKSTLRIKIQCWFFLWRYMNTSPLEISTTKNC